MKTETKFTIAVALVWLLMPVLGVVSFFRGVRGSLSGKAARRGR